MENDAQIQIDEQATRVEKGVDDLSYKIDQLINKVDNGQTMSAEEENLVRTKFTSMKESKENLDNLINNSNIG